MRKIKWGVMGTAYILERDTARGMHLAKNCELTAIAGRSMESMYCVKNPWHPTLSRRRRCFARQERIM